MKFCRVPDPSILMNDKLLLSMFHRGDMLEIVRQTKVMHS